MQYSLQTHLDTLFNISINIVISRLINMIYIINNKFVVFVRTLPRFAMDDIGYHLSCYFTLQNSLAHISKYYKLLDYPTCSVACQVKFTWWILTGIAGILCCAFLKSCVNGAIFPSDTIKISSSNPVKKCVSKRSYMKMLVLHNASNLLKSKVIAQLLWMRKWKVTYMHFLALTFSYIC